jgi:hypothetical protein
MTKTLDELRQELDKEFQQVRKHLSKIHEALDKLEKAGPEDDVSGLLKKLEDEVKDVRTGGLLGSGAHGHEKALKNYQEAKGKS